MTIGFEEMEEHLEEHTSKNLKPIIESLFGEMTILGFLSAITFTVTKMGVFESLSSYLFGEEEDEFLIELFELVHFTIFFIMILFVIQVLIIAVQAGSIEKKWEEWNRCMLDPKLKKMVKRHTKGHKVDSKTENFLLRLLFPARENSDSFVRGYAMFAGLRDEFVKERSLVPPFDELPVEKRVPEDFNFGRYLSIALGRELGKAVCVSVKSWFCVIAFTLMFYLISILLWFNVVALSIVWVAICWGVLVSNVVFENYLVRIRDAFAGLNIDLEHFSLRKSQIDFDASALKDLEAAAEETTAIVPNKQEKSYQSANGKEDNLPAWTKVDMDDFNERSERQHKTILAKLLGFEKKNVHRQNSLYWFANNGPKLHIMILQLNLVYNGIYSSLLIMAFIPAMFEACSTTLFIVWLILALLPIGGIMLNKKQMVATMTIVNSIGNLRKPKVTTDVIREEKTVAAVRALLIFDKLNRAVENPTPPSDPDDYDDVTIDHAEIIAVGHTFDGFDNSHTGTITHDDFAGVMKSLVNSIDENKVKAMIEMLDADGDGEISREEFLNWYKMKMAEGEHVSHEEQAHHLFKMFDEDGSGMITISELKDTLDAFNLGFTLEEVGDLVHELDEDGDNAIGLEEFEELIEKYAPKEISTVGLLDKEASGHHLGGM